MTDEERFEELLESDQSDPEIQYQLGLCYLRGLGVAQDGAQAEAWLRRAADQGHPMACLVLAKRRLDQKLYEEAIPLLRNAADCSLTEAMELLAVSYGTGRGVEQDPKEAELWFRRPRGR